ncbi:DDHD2 Phospholipase, partial [Smithornis capensis]|nr:DDHD2 Phospholipase [Smithornis capensis]
EAYMIAVTLDEWKKKLESPSREIIILHNPKLMVHYHPIAGSDDWVSTPTEQGRPRTVKRGVENIAVEIPSGELPSAFHPPRAGQCFLTCSLKNIGTSSCDHLSKVHIQTFFARRNQMVSETSPAPESCSVSEQGLHTQDEGGELPAPAQRQSCWEFLSLVGTEGFITYLHAGDFLGHVVSPSLKLRSLILFDLLTNQKADSEEDEHSAQGSRTTSSNGGIEEVKEILKKLELSEYCDVFEKEKMDRQALFLCTEKNLEEMGIPLGPRVKILHYISSKADTQVCFLHGLCSFHHIPNPPLTRGPFSNLNFPLPQVSANYPQLNYKPTIFFAFGSPIGMFLTVRGVKRIDPNYSLPTCKGFFNIFHPFDPVAYRIEPMIVPDVEFEPMLLPHHKGRKRMHLELKEGLTRMSVDLKNNLLGSLRVAWQSFTRAPVPALEAGGTDEAEAEAGTDRQ